MPRQSPTDDEIRRWHAEYIERQGFTMKQTAEIVGWAYSTIARRMSDLALPIPRRGRASSGNGEAAEDDFDDKAAMAAIHEKARQTVADALPPGWGAVETAVELPRRYDSKYAEVAELIIGAAGRAWARIAAPDANAVRGLRDHLKRRCPEIELRQLTDGGEVFLYWRLPGAE